MVELADALNRHLGELAGRIGNRRIGSAGNLAAANYLHGEMTKLGLATEVQEIPCPEWTLAKAELESDGRVLPVWADPFSPPADVAAGIVAIGTLAELERSELRGKIALFYGDLTHSPIPPKAWFLITERERRIISLLESKSPEAVISAQPAVPYFSCGFCDAEFRIPSATVPREAALDLLRAERPAVRLRIETIRGEGKTANIVGRITGSRREKIVLCAHYDTAAYTPGACDNAGGVAILLALAEHFSRRPAECALEFAAFSGHEYLPLGSATYIQSARPETMIAVLNFDGAGHHLGANTLAAMAASARLIETAKSKLDSRPDALWVEPWPESDHSLFAMREVPALAFSSAGAREIMHSPQDDLNGMSPVKLNEAASIAAEIIRAIQDKTLDWGRVSSSPA